MLRSTTILARLQELRRRRRRKEKKHRKLDLADVVLVSHAKSGRTWLLTMLSRYFHLRYGTPANELVSGDNFKLHDSTIPSIFYTSGWEFGPRVKVEELLSDKKVVLLYRDPRDVVVSWFHHMTHRMPAMERIYRLQGNSMPKELTVSVALKPEWLPAVVHFMNEWLHRCRKLPRTHIVSYESLRVEPETNLRRLLAFIGESPTLRAVSEAASFGSFENMKTLERAGYFATGRLGGGSEDPNSFKVRRGRIGGYVEHFGAHGAALDAFVESHLDPSFGYGRLDAISMA
jgi:Sulfotransferase domain